MNLAPRTIPSAALAYFAGVFALGFVLGAGRTLWLAPRIGALEAVAVEMPFMLGASWLLARRLTRPPALARLSARGAMGALALALLLAAELVLGVTLFGQTPEQWLAALATPPGALGLAGQALFGLMPLAARRGPARRRSRLSLFGLRPFGLAVILAASWIGLDPGLVEAPAFLTAEPERVALPFTRCGRGRGEACVIDGDTFKIGERKIRVVGIDAPEVKASCPEEARAAEAATLELLRLLDLGPFEMVARLDRPTDRWGRELRTVRRMGQDGVWVSIADQMRESGTVRRYLGGLREGWC